MKILLVSLHFPPVNTMGALRAGGLAKYLLRQGHDVRVLTARDTGFAETLTMDFPPERVTYTAWRDINWLPKAAATVVRGVDRFAVRHVRATSRRHGSAGSKATEEKSHGWSWREVLYRTLLDWPDQWIGWMPPALAAARPLIGQWTPDVIYASGPPHSGLLIGYALARRYHLPWMAELRDRWVDDPYRRYPRWRTWVEERVLERPILNSAAGIVTVSEPWAHFYSRKYSLPTLVVANGYDPADYDCQSTPTTVVPEYLRIVYTGGIYAGRRDPSPLFEALARLGKDQENIRVEFFGADESRVLPHAVRHGVSDLVAVHASVTHENSVALQCQADVLLLIQWNDPREHGNVPGKLFEYLGARRPILGLGPEDGVPAMIIRERSAGFFSSNPESIAMQLRAWLEIKRRSGSIPELPEAARAGLSRSEQFGKLATSLQSLIPPNSDGQRNRGRQNDFSLG